MFKQIQKKECKTSPVFIKWNMEKGMTITSFTSLGPSNIKPNEWRKKHNLPYSDVLAYDYSPSRIYLLNSTRIESEQEGWNCDGQWDWQNTPYRVKERITKSLVEKHLKSIKKEKIGGSWVLEGPIEVPSEDGRLSKIWICADFTYCDLSGSDGIVVSISRKVQSALSLWDEKCKGLLIEDSKHLRVKVAVADDPKRRDSKEFSSWTDENLHFPAWEGSNSSVADYWESNGYQYTENDKNEIKVIEVKGFSGKTNRYPSDKAYRVMSMDQWPVEVRERLSEYLGMKPSAYLKQVKKAMAWLRNINFLNELAFGWENHSDVQFFDSREHLFLPNGKKLLDDKWRLNQHIKEFESLHDGRPPPSIDVYFMVPKGFENLTPNLKNHAEEIYKQIPYWLERVSFKETIVVPEHSQLAAENVLEDFIDNVKNTKGRSVVVFSALTPMQQKTNVNLYKCIKYNLTQHGIVHQNFRIGEYGKLSKGADFFSGQVNVFQMLMKHGFLPVPHYCDIGDIDMITGIDVGRIRRNRSVAAVAISITKSGYLWGTTPSPEPQTGETISEESLRRMFKKMIRDYRTNEGVFPKRLLILRDGNTPPSEHRNLKKIIQEYRLESKIDICWISIRKSGCPRLLLFDEMDVIDQLPTKGHYLPWSTDSAWIWTTGYPNLTPGSPGIPSGINFTILENFSNQALTIIEASKLLICQSHSSQSQPYNSTRLPFVLHLADRQAKAMGNEQIPLDSTSRRFSAA